MAGLRGVVGPTTNENFVPPEAPLPAAPADFGGSYLESLATEAQRGVTRGAGGLWQGARAGAGALGQVVGADEWGTSLIRDSSRESARIQQENPAAVETWRDVGGAGDLGKYLVGKVGEAVPSVPLRLGGRGAGALVGAGARGVAGRSLASAAGGAETGMYVGGATSMYPSSVGGMAQAIQDAPGMSSAERGVYSLGWGVPLAATESLAPNLMARSLIQNTAKSGVMGNTAKATVAEGASAVANDAIAQGAEMNVLPGQQFNQSRMEEAAIGEMVGNVGTSGAYGVAGKLRESGADIGGAVADTARRAYSGAKGLVGAGTEQAADITMDGVKSAVGAGIDAVGAGASAAAAVGAKAWNARPTRDEFITSIGEATSGAVGAAYDATDRVLFKGRDPDLDVLLKSQRGMDANALMADDAAKNASAQKLASFVLENEPDVPSHVFSAAVEYNNGPQSQDAWRKFSHSVRDWQRTDTIREAISEFGNALTPGDTKQNAQQVRRLPAQEFAQSQADNIDPLLSDALFPHMKLEENPDILEVMPEAATKFRAWVASGMPITDRRILKALDNMFPDGAQQAVIDGVRLLKQEGVTEYGENLVQDGVDAQLSQAVEALGLVRAAKDGALSTAASALRPSFLAEQKMTGEEAAPHAVQFVRDMLISGEIDEAALTRMLGSKKELLIEAVGQELREMNQLDVETPGATVDNIDEDVSGSDALNLGDVEQQDEVAEQQYEIHMYGDRPYHVGETIRGSEIGTHDKHAENKIGVLESTNASRVDRVGYIDALAAQFPDEIERTAAINAFVQEHRNEIPAENRSDPVAWLNKQYFVLREEKQGMREDRITIDPRELAQTTHTASGNVFGQGTGQGNIYGTAADGVIWLEKFKGGVRADGKPVVPNQKPTIFATSTAKLLSRMNKGKDEVNRAGTNDLAGRKAQNLIAAAISGLMNTGLIGRMGVLDKPGSVDNIRWMAPNDVLPDVLRLSRAAGTVGAAREAQHMAAFNEGAAKLSEHGAYLKEQKDIKLKEAATTKSVRSYVKGRLARLEKDKENAPPDEHDKLTTHAYSDIKKQALLNGMTVPRLKAYYSALHYERKIAALKQGLDRAGALGSIEDINSMLKEYDLYGDKDFSEGKDISEKSTTYKAGPDHSVTLVDKNGNEITATETDIEAMRARNPNAGHGIGTKRVRSRNAGYPDRQAKEFGPQTMGRQTIVPPPKPAATRYLTNKYGEFILDSKGQKIERQHEGLPTSSTDHGSRSKYGTPIDKLAERVASAPDSELMSLKGSQLTRETRPGERNYNEDTLEPLVPRLNLVEQKNLMAAKDLPSQSAIESRLVEGFKAALHPVLREHAKHVVVVERATLGGAAAGRAYGNGRIDIARDTMSTERKEDKATKTFYDKPKPLRISPKDYASAIVAHEAAHNLDASADHLYSDNMATTFKEAKALMATLPNEHFLKPWLYLAIREDKGWTETYQKRELLAQLAALYHHNPTYLKKEFEIGFNFVERMYGHAAENASKPAGVERVTLPTNQTDAGTGSDAAGVAEGEETGSADAVQRAKDLEVSLSTLRSVVNRMLEKPPTDTLIEQARAMVSSAIEKHGEDAAIDKLSNDIEAAIAGRKPSRATESDAELEAALESLRDEDGSINDGGIERDYDADMIAEEVGTASVRDFVDAAKPPAHAAAKEQAKANGADFVYAPEGVSGSFASRLAAEAKTEGKLIDPHGSESLRGKVVYVSVPGASRGFKGVGEMIEGVQKLMARGATIRIDNKDNASTEHNAPGEGKLRQVLAFGFGKYVFSEKGAYDEVYQNLPREKKPIKEITPDYADDRKANAQSPNASYPDDATPMQRKHFRDTESVTPAMHKVILSEVNGKYSGVEVENEGVADKDGWYNINHPGIQTRVTDEAVHEEHPDSFMEDQIQEYRVEGVKGVFYTQSAAQWARHLRDDRKANAQSAQDPFAGADVAYKADVKTREKIIADGVRRLGEGMTTEFHDKLFGKDAAGRKIEISGDWAANILRISNYAGDPGQIAAHEHFHEFFSRLMAAANATNAVVVKGAPGPKDAQRVVEILDKAASSAPVIRQLERLLVDHVEAKKQLTDPEERMAYMFQFHQAGLLQLGPETKTLFNKIADFFRRITGLLSNDQKAAALMVSFDKGEMHTPDAAAHVLADNIEYRERLIDMAKEGLRPVAAVVERLIGASSENLLRTDNPSLHKISRLFKTPTGEGGRQSFMAAKDQQMKIWSNRFVNSIAEFSPKDLELAARFLHSGETSTDPIVNKIVERIKGPDGILEGMHKYLKNAGVKLWVENPDGSGSWEDLGHVKNYFMRSYDVRAIMEKSDEFIADLHKHHEAALEDILKTAKKEIEGEMYAGKGTTSDSAGIDINWGRFKDADEALKNITTDDVAIAIVNRIVNSYGQVALGETVGSVGFSPYMRAVNKRTLKWLDPVVFEKYMNHDVAEMMTSYIAQGVKRAEYVRRFGNGGEQMLNLMNKAHAFELDKIVKEKFGIDGVTAKAHGARKKDESFGDALAKILAGGGIGDINEARALFKAASAKLAPSAKDIMAMEGTLGYDITPGKRNLFGAVIAYENLRTMVMSLFSQVIDPLGIMVRGGEMKDAWNAAKTGISEVIKSWKGEHSKDEMARIAEQIGTADAHGFLAAFGQQSASMYLGKHVRAVNDGLFRWNGMEGFNRGMQIGATQAAINFIKKHATRPEKHSEAYLAELGIMPTFDVSAAEAELKRRDAEASKRFKSVAEIHREWDAAKKTKAGPDEILSHAMSKEINGSGRSSLSISIERAKAAGGTIPSERVRSEMADLGITLKADVKILPDGNLDYSDPVIQQAIHRWVNGAILRPNAGQRPAWASDPHYMLFWHMKQFTYTFHDVLVKRAIHDAKHFDNLSSLAPLLAGAPFMLMSDYAKAALLSGGEPAWAHGDMHDAMMHGVNRAGLFGKYQIGADATIGPHGMSTLFGPAGEQAINAVTDPIGETVGQALPGASALNSLFGRNNVAI